ncbi:right-handed parallel beta-helix repeat-containing protein [Methanocrinis sp.]|uniref:right-handed parallel beta-helix repeat-containing protein n=1 Tax=Methanocrinis sp. TaxID=3101522 RepID=UPI003D108D3B
MLRNSVYRRVLVISVIFLALLVGLTFATTYVVSPDYDDRFIQATIDRASDGDRIVVKSGLYSENLQINKKLAVVGLDTGNGRPVVDAEGFGTAIVISADGVLLEGFEATNSGSLWKDAGIKVTSNNSVIRDNNVTGNEYGIVLDGSANNNVAKNSVCNNDVGISLYSSEKCTITENYACNNTFGGILLSKANNNSIRNNNASLNQWAGIILGECSNNTVSNNIARYNDNEGIWLLRSAGNTVRGNRVRYNYIFGIRLFFSNRNAITSNTVRNNLDGVSLENSNGNVLAGNNLSINDYGIYIDNSFNNRIYMNNLIDNQKSAHSWNSSNFWNSTDRLSYIYNGVAYKRYIGNYWSGYFGPDPFGDGLGDLPQAVSDTEKDHNPLKKPSEKYTLRG